MPDASHDEPDQTSDRLYTPADLSQVERLRDPLSDPLPTDGTPASDPAADPAEASVPPPQPPPPAEEPAAPPPPSGPPPSGPPPAGPPAAPPPSGPPPAGPPAEPQSPQQPVEGHTQPRTAPPAAEPPLAAEQAPPGWPGAPAPDAGNAQPAQPGPVQPQPAQAQPAQAQWAPPEPAQPEPGYEEPRRFMTATDFLDRRSESGEPGPATWGWRGRVRRWSGGVINPRMGAAERAHEDCRRAIQRDFQGPRTIAFINPKGGAAKTTGVLAAGYTFGTVRGGGVVAWDNNETRGTLGIRGIRGSHHNTTRELLEDLGRFSDVYQSRIGDLGAFVRSQGDAHFDVLASDERADVTGQIHADDFRSVHALLERFYRVILVDTGNNMRAENWLAAAEAADLLVVTSTVREDTGYSGLWMLDALSDAGYGNLKYKAITVLSDPSPTVDADLAADLVDVYEQRTRAVFRVPYDPVLVSGSVVPYGKLSEDTRESWLRACAAMAEAL